MVHWESLLSDGNDCFHSGNLREAEYYYKEAAFHLDYLWSVNTKKTSFLMAWICAYHNLASLFEARGEPELSLQYLLVPHNKMLSVSMSNKSCEDTKLITQNALKITFKPILMFSNRHPVCDTCRASLSEFKSNLESTKLITH